MRKVAYLFVTVAFIYFFTFVTFAQSLFVSTSVPKKNQGVQTHNPSTPPTQVLSPEEFQNTVKMRHQQIQNKYQEELNQQLSKRALPPQPTITPSATNNKTPQDQPPAEIASPPPALPQAPPVQPQQPSASSAPPLATTPPPAPVTTPPAQPSQEQIYTGFQGGDSGNTTTKPSGQQSDGGWNIKY